MTSTLKLQKDVKDNAEDLQNFLKDLESWEKEIKEVDDNLCSGKSPTNEVEEKNLPPVRSRNHITSTQEERKKKQRVVQEESSSTKEKIKRISSSDYAAWDKFDVDKALESDEEKKDEEERESKEKRKEEALALKNEGNKYYSAGKLKEAVVQYTQAIALDPSNPALSANRAMAYIKMERFEEAELDCNRCLKLDPTYIKAVLRRATARRALGKNDLAKQDYEKVLQLEPWNKDAKKELESLKKKPQGKVGSRTANKSGSTKSSLDTYQKSQSRSSTSPETKPKCKSETSDTTSLPKTAEISKKLKNEDGKEKQKKLKVVEVNSAAEDGDKRTSDEVDPNIVLPVKKPPHLQSQKPMRRLNIEEVATRADIPNFAVLQPEHTSKVFEHQQSLQKHSQEHPKNEGSTQPMSVVKTSVKNGSQSKDQSVQDTARSIVTIPKLPRTSHQFAQHLQMLKSNTELAVQYLQSIKVEFFKGIEMEADTIADVATILSLDIFEVETAVKYVRALISSRGFTVNLLFLEDHQKKELSKVIDKCKTAAEVKDLLQLQEKLK